jgi:hypothetical protein
MTPSRPEKDDDSHFCLFAFLTTVILFSLAACNFVESSLPSTATPTRALSGPTLAPSPTVLILPVDQLDSSFTSGQNDPTVAAMPNDAALPPLPVGTKPPDSSSQMVDFPADDGTLLVGELYESGIDRLPGVLIVSSDPAAWGDFPLRLHNAGFTVLVMQLRQPLSVADFSVMLRALSDLGTVNPGSLGAIGAESGADLVLIGCAADSVCDTAVMLSPSGSDTLLNVIADFSPRPLMLSASQDDPESFQMMQSLQALATGEVLAQPFNAAGRGVAMLQARPDLGDLIIQWLQRHLGG